jgi:hypothetical protein
VIAICTALDGVLLISLGFRYAHSESVLFLSDPVKLEIPINSDLLYRDQLSVSPNSRPILCACASVHCRELEPGSDNVYMRGQSASWLTARASSWYPSNSRILCCTTRPQARLTTRGTTTRRRIRRLARVWVPWRTACHAAALHNVKRTTACGEQRRTL